ncbi:YdcF family protein [Clostridium sp. LBM24168]
MKRSLKGVLCFSTIAFVAVLITGFEIVFFGENSKPEKSDCIIVLGCKVYGSTPSPFLAARIDEGLRLYNSGYGNYIIVSGGKGIGENISEAQAMKNYLIFKGVNSSRIIMEDESASTMSNLINSSKIMRREGFKTAVIVSNKFHLKRASLMAKKQNIHCSYSGVFVSKYKGHEIKGYIREIPALWKYYLIQANILSICEIARSAIIL